jgi:hypothetical protein
VAADQRVWEIKLWEICMEQREISVEVMKAEEIWTIGSRRTRGRDPRTLEEEHFGENSVWRNKNS